MNCKNCGTPLPDGAKFCGACGALQEVAAPVEAPAAVAPVEAPVEAPAVAPVEAPVEAAAEVAAPVEMPYAAPADFAAPDFSAEEPKKKKFKLKRIILPAVAVLSAAAVLLCVFNWGWIKLWFTDMFGKPEALRDQVVAEQTETLANNLSKQYGNSIRTMKDVMNGDKYVSASMELVVGDVAEDLLLEAMGDVDGAEELISQLDGTYITFAGGNTDDLFQLAYQVGIGGKELLSVGAIADFVNRELYVAVPTLSDYYLDLSTYFADAMAELEASIQQEDIEAMAAAAELLDALPSEEVVNKLLKKYIAVALAEFDDVSKDKETLSIGGIKEKVTVLETSISEADAMAAVKAVLKEVAKDSDIEKIIVDFVDTVNGIEDTGMSGDEVYAELQAAIEVALEGMDEYEPDTEEILVVTQYLNSAYESVGIAIEAEGEEILYFATATKGNNFACEMKVSGIEILSGKGTNKKGIINGTFSVEVEGQEIVDIKVSNFDQNAFEQGYLKGSFEIAPSDELVQMALDSADLPSAITSVVSLTDLSLKLDFDSSENSSSVQIGIAADGEVMLGIKLTTSITDKEVTVPSADRTTDDVMEWVSTFDFDALLDALMDLGLPSDLLDELGDGFGSLLGT